MKGEGEIDSQVDSSWCRLANATKDPEAGSRSLAESRDSDRPLPKRKMEAQLPTERRGGKPTDFIPNGHGFQKLCDTVLDSWHSLMVQWERFADELSMKSERKRGVQDGWRLGLWAIRRIKMPSSLSRSQVVSFIHVTLRYLLTYKWREMLGKQLDIQAYRRDVQAGNINFRVVSRWIILKSMSLVEHLRGKQRQNSGKIQDWAQGCWNVRGRGDVEPEKGDFRRASSEIRETRREGGVLETRQRMCPGGGSWSIVSNAVYRELRIDQRA